MNFKTDPFWGLRVLLCPKKQENAMSASEKQPDAPTYTAANVTPLPSAAKKGAIPINGYSVHDTEITHNGQRLYPGVWMHYSNKTREGEEESTHEWLCGPLHVDAIPLARLSAIGQ